MAVQLKVGDRLSPVTRDVTNEKMIEFEKCVWDRGRNSHSDINAAKADGISRTIASGQNQMAFLHELLERNFGDSWVYGGQISVRYIHPVFAGDRLTAHGVVADLVDHGGRPGVVVQVWCENQNGVKTSAGTVRAAQPSDRRSWIAHAGATA